jgi:hypothetical protein
MFTVNRFVSAITVGSESEVFNIQAHFTLVLEILQYLDNQIV